MKTLHRTQHGSHLYGTNVEGSDLDFKTVVVPSLNDLLLAKPKLTKNKVTQTDDVDSEVLTLHTLTRDFVDGQSYALEVVFAAAQQTDTTLEFQAYCEKLKPLLTNEMNSLVGYLMGQFSKYADKGERYSDVKKALDVLSATVGPRNIFVKMYEVLPAVMKEFEGSEYVKLVNHEGQDFFEVLGRKYGVTLLVREVTERLQALLESFGARTKKAAVDGAPDWKALMHAVRVGLEAEELLSSNTLTLPFSGEKQQLLLDIRNGKKTLDEVRDLLNKQLSLISELKSKSTLPPSADVKERAEALLLSFLKTHYKLQ